MSSDQDSVPAHLRSFLEAVLKLVAHHLELAKLELIGDIKAIGIRAGLVVGMLPLIILGYILIAAAGAKALGRVGIAFDLGLLIVGGGHIVIAVVVILVALKGIKGRKLMANTVRETKSSLAALSTGALQPQLEAHDGR